MCAKKLPPPEGLDPTTLRRLYCVDLLTEGEIAERFGTYQVRINKLRRAWGIPTLGKTGRLALALPAVTPYQDQILTGSLLGDGSMGASSARSARFWEGHCDEQKDYLLWKHEALKPFATNLGKTVKREGDREFHGWYFNTHSCPQLRLYYDLFYPPPQRKRVFPEDLPSRMTPLVLAIWYMDDGLVGRGEPCISYGLGSVSLKRAVAALRTLGLKPGVLGKGSNQLIIFPKQANAFHRLVEPYIVPCLAYKMPSETPRQAGDRNARRLTAEHAVELSVGGMTVDAIAAFYDVGVSTVRRRLRRAGAPKGKPGRRGDRLTVGAATILLEKYRFPDWDALAQEDQDRRVGEIAAILRRAPFPQEEPGGPEEACKAREKLKALRMSVVDGSIEPLHRVGVGLCATYFPLRYKASWRGHKTAYETWHTDRGLCRAIWFQLKVGDPVVPHRVLRAITLACRTPTVFRPSVARFLYVRYCPVGGVVWDPCAGYGGRLLGAMAAGVQYIGTDVEEGVIEGNRLLADHLGYKADLHLCAAEGFNPPEVDMVFTSPPYFDVERYTSNDHQSWRRYSTFGAWVDGFLAPVVGKAYVALRPGGCLILNVADIRVREGVVLPLAETTKDIAGRTGFTLEETLYMPLSGLNRKAPSEPVLVFRRPGGDSRVRASTIFDVLGTEDSAG